MPDILPGNKRDYRMNSLFFVIDNKSGRGITDRLKAAVGLYYAALKNGLDYRFIHQAEFDIRDYLVPNIVPWSAELSDVPRLPWKKKEIRYVPPFSDLDGLSPGTDYVCRTYCGNNILEKMRVPGWHRVWRELSAICFHPGKK